jgi:hypothetical protein
MSFESLKNTSMDVWREGSPSKNAIGESEGTWGAIEESVSVRWQPTGGEERTDESKAALRLGKVWFDLGLDLRASDRVEIDGDFWEVVTVDPDVAGAGHHGAAELRQVTL